MVMSKGPYTTWYDKFLAKQLNGKKELEKLVIDMFLELEII